MEVLSSAVVEFARWLVRTSGQAAVLMASFFWRNGCFENIWPRGGGAHFGCWC